MHVFSFERYCQSALQSVPFCIPPAVYESACIFTYSLTLDIIDLVQTEEQISAPLGRAARGVEQSQGEHPCLQEHPQRLHFWHQQPDTSEHSTIKAIVSPIGRGWRKFENLSRNAGSSVSYVIKAGNALNSTFFKKVGTVGLIPVILHKTDT